MSSKPGQYDMDTMVGAEVTLNNKPYLYFAGTSYFQLHAHPELIEAAISATARFGIGSATSRTLTGTTPLLKELEKQVAGYFNTEDAAYLPSGYLSSLGGLKALASLNKFNTIFIDEGSHYSLLENSLATGKKVISFNHKDPDDLREKIKLHSDKRDSFLIASDGLFPVSAKFAPLGKYLEIAEEFGGVIWVDDAHGVGILGSNGRGSCEFLGVKSNRVFIGATLSKAFGAYGGIIPGPAPFIEELRRGSVMTGSSSPMNAAVAAGIKGIELLRSHPELREKLWQNSKLLKKGLSLIGIAVDQNEVPIVSFHQGDAAKMQAIQQELMNRGIYIQFTHYQGAGSEGVLRIVVSSGHTADQINKLLTALREIL